MSTSKQARHSHFQRGSGAYACRSCGHNTRDTGDNGQVQLCPVCYELAGYDNQLSDDRSLSDSEVVTVRSLLTQLCNQVNNPEAAKAEFPALTSYVGFNGPLPAPVEQAPAPASLTDKLEWLIHVNGIEDDPDFVMLVVAPNDVQARRVAKRMVQAERSLDGLGFRIEKRED